MGRRSFTYEYRIQILQMVLQEFDPSGSGDGECENIVSRRLLYRASEEIGDVSQYRAGTGVPLRLCRHRSGTFTDVARVPLCGSGSVDPGPLAPSF